MLTQKLEIVTKNYYEGAIGHKLFDLTKCIY